MKIDEPSVAPTELYLGDYILLREIGRGASGVVYEAVQLSLKRRVAIKVLAGFAAVDECRRGRFRLEARLAAQLHHPHLVPVHGLGCSDGVDFYAMQLVDGPSLAVVAAEWASTAPASFGRNSRRQNRRRGGKVSFVKPLQRNESVKLPLPSRFSRFRDGKMKEIDGTPLIPANAEGRSESDWNAVLETHRFRLTATWGMQAAAGLQCMHEAGLVHGDVKPSNLLLGSDARLWVADFGLAAAMQDASSSRTAGTPRYQSPERLVGRGAGDPRSDLYALGATLYELLTGVPAFEDAEPSSMAKRIAGGEALPPRRRNSRIPRPLASIVEKAMEPRAVDRYQTAREIRGDLERFLKGEPVHPRRRSWIQRTAAKVLSRPARTLAAGVTAMFAILALTGAACWMNDQRTRGDHAIDAVLEELPQAADAMAAFHAKEFLAGGSDDSLRVVSDALLLRILHSNVASAELASRLNLDYPAYRLWRLAAMLQQSRGRFDEAAESFDRAHIHLTAYQINHPDGPDLRWLNASLANDRHFLLVNKGDLSAARKLLESAAAELARFKESNSSQDLKKVSLAVYNNLFALDLRQGRRSDAEAHEQAVLALWPQLENNESANCELRFARGLTHFNRGAKLRQAGRTREAAVDFETALAAAENLMRDRFDVDALGRILSWRDVAALTQLDLDRAEEAYRRLSDASPQWKRCIAGRPDAVEYTFLAARHFHWLGRAASATGRIEEAEKAFREGISLVRPLLEKASANADYRTEWAGLENDAGGLFKKTGRLTLTQIYYARALELLENAPPETRSLPTVVEEIPRYQNNLAVVVWENGGYDRAEQLLRTAVQLQMELASSHGDVPKHREVLAVMCENLGDLCVQRKNLLGAEQAFRLQASHYEALGASIGDLRRVWQLAGSRAKLGRALCWLGRAEEAKREWCEAERLYFVCMRGVAQSLDVANVGRALTQFWLAHPEMNTEAKQIRAVAGRAAIAHVKHATVLFFQRVRQSRAGDCGAVIKALRDIPPKQGALALTEGVIHYRAGELRAARDALTSIATTEAEWPYARLTLAMIAVRQGEQDQALRHYALAAASIARMTRPELELSALQRKAVEALATPGAPLSIAKIR